MASGIMVYNPYQSMRTHVAPSAIRRYWDGITASVSRVGGRSGGIERPEGFIRQNVESVATGGFLGLLHAHLPTGLDFHKAPLDAVLAVLAGLAGRHGPLARGNVAKSLRTIGGNAASIFAFRETTRLFAAKAGATAHGDMGADPLDDAARAL